MSVGNSGRIVIEIEPDLKKELYGNLKKDGISLKEWFLNNTKDYLVNNDQLSLPLALETKESQEVSAK